MRDITLLGTIVPARVSTGVATVKLCGIPRLAPTDSWDKEDKDSFISVDEEYQNYTGKMINGVFVENDVDAKLAAKAAKAAKLEESLASATYVVEKVCEECGAPMGVSLATRESFTKLIGRSYPGLQEHNDSEVSDAILRAASKGYTLYKLVFSSCRACRGH